MPVVKADAYRHGAVEVSRILTQEGARWLAVSNVEEGVTLRQAGITARILVMGDFLPFERPALIDYELTPCIHSIAQLLDYDRMGAALARPLPYHLALDTGMSRLGTREEPSTLARAIAGPASCAVGTEALGSALCAAAAAACAAGLGSSTVDAAMIAG